MAAAQPTKRRIDHYCICQLSAFLGLHDKVHTFMLTAASSHSEVLASPP